MSSIYDMVVGWVNAIKGAISSIADMASNVISGIKSSFSGLGIKAYADGGFPNTGQLFIANEAGPELIGTIGGKTAVGSGAEITGIRDEIYALRQDQAQTQSMVISLLQIIADKDPSLNIDGREFVNAYDNRKQRNGFAFT